jgi:hypothetical protein
MLTRITVCGNQGKWSVFIPDYGDVGIVADHWKHGGPEDCPDTHHDPNLFPGCSRNTKATKLADLLMTTKLAVTADIPLIEGPDGFLKGDKRREYFFLWKIDDVTFDEEGIKFSYVECLADVGKKHKWQEKKKRTRRGVGSY